MPDDDLAVALGDTGVEVLQAVGLEVDEGVQRSAAGEHAGGGVDATAGETGIGAIGHVVDGPGGGGHGELAAIGNHAAMLCIDGWVDGGEEVVGAKFADDAAGVRGVVNDGDVGVDDVVELDGPVLFAGEVNGSVEGGWVVVGKGIG